MSETDAKSPPLTHFIIGIEKRGRDRSRRQPACAASPLRGPTAVQPRPALRRSRLRVGLGGELRAMGRRCRRRPQRSMARRWPGRSRRARGLLLNRGGDDRQAVCVVLERIDRVVSPFTNARSHDVIQRRRLHGLSGSGAAKQTHDGDRSATRRTRRGLRAPAPTSAPPAPRSRAQRAWRCAGPANGRSRSGGTERGPATASVRRRRGLSRPDLGLQAAGSDEQFGEHGLRSGVGLGGVGRALGAVGQEVQVDLPAPQPQGHGEVVERNDARALLVEPAD